MDAVRALALAGLLLACAVPAGAGLLRLVGLEEKHTTGRAERWLLSRALGLGLLATAYTLIGLAGLFTPPLVLLLPPALALALLLPGRAFLAAPGQGAPRRDVVSGFHTWATLATVVALGVLALAVLGQDRGPPPPTTTACCTTWWPPRLSCRRGASSTSLTTSRPISPPWANCSTPSGWPRGATAHRN